MLNLSTYEKQICSQQGEDGVIAGDVSGGRLRHDWYKKASDMSHHNTYNMFNQSKIYTWKDVFDD